MLFKFELPVFHVLISFLLILTVSSEHEIFKRQAGNTLTKWPENTVYYYFKNLTNAQKQLANRVMKQIIQPGTCLSFVQNPAATNRIALINNPDIEFCVSSDYGMKGGEQTITMGSKCIYDGLLGKAFFHTFGFYPMEVRPDRNTFITVDWNNVNPELANNLKIINSTYLANMLQYNYGSIIHSGWDMYAFNETYDYPFTLKQQQYYLAVGQGIMTSYDLEILNKFYQCDASCPDANITCENEGSLNTRNCNKCNCPLGFSGKLCKALPDGGTKLTAGSEWQQATINVAGSSSPENPGPYLTQTFWIVKPPSYNYVQFQILNFTVEGEKTCCTPGCRDFGVEIKYRTHQARTSPRVCCNAFEDSTFSSFHNTTAVVAYTSTVDVSVTIQYKASLDNFTALPTPSDYNAPCPSGCELPSSVCGVLTTVQQIFLPLMEYFVDPIGLIRVFITNGATLNCTSATNVTNEDDQFAVQFGDTFNGYCPTVLTVAGWANWFFTMIGVENSLASAGTYVAILQEIYNYQIQSLRQGIHDVTPEVCPGFDPEATYTLQQYIDFLAGARPHPLRKGARDGQERGRTSQREMPPFGPRSCRVGPVSAPTRHERGTNAARMREEREIMRETARQTRPERGTNEGGTRNAARTREERGTRHERGRNEERGTNAARTGAFLSVLLSKNYGYRERSNFDEGWEEEGAAFAVYHKGKLVVDLWGGFMEKKCYRLWKKDTMTCLFSLTKSVGALCLAMLVDRGLCSYDDKVSKFWPEYAKSGKEDTTIAMVLEHRTGLPYFDRNIIKEDLDDPARMRKLIEDEKPKYKIGTNIAYHALTYGWILDSALFSDNNPYNSGNNADSRQWSQPACNGIGTARALAELYVKTFEGGLLSRELVEIFKEPTQLNKFDYTLGHAQHKGRGFFYYRSPTGSWKIGHFGVGGQTAHYDFDNRLSIVYLCNGMNWPEKMLAIGLLYLFPTHYHLIPPFIIFVLLGLLIKRIYCPRRNAPINGTCDPEFEAIREVFRKNFDEGWEEEGAAFAVYHKGKLVVDLWGGFMEKKCYRLWKQDTLNVLFSCTKSIAAICMATLVDKGLCSYDDRISKFWPGYSKNGKGETTISMLLEHRAGLPHFQRNITLEVANDPEGIRKLIEDERPIIEIGKDTAYHSVTYGFILDLLFQIIDPNKRNIGQFIKEEIAEKYSKTI
ncbi:hypothetical protein WR25_19392 isoform B [Diploscapter pachys]|uniref:Metalloendopeptidase n=1 Tax=Diploscapter pachys TaxID=2018661 RepID=A0A2A2K9M7_9BILA|nr:hypothetical protein WR25_19392 isoform A [Diploscapter pachys]PAV70499.1 hypothetical protein WR25_19392 isoform B [Diploscapter pachys]